MKSIGFLVRLILIVLLIVWLVDKPGNAQIVWRDTIIEMSAAVLFVIVGLLVYAALLAHRLWRSFWDGPRFWLLKRKIGKMEEGQSEIVRGLASIASSDAPSAEAHANRARKLLGETPTVRLLQAQAAQLAGNYTAAKAIFTSMAADPDAAVLGYRGQIMLAIRAGNYDEALSLAARLEKEKGNVPWLHALRFQIDARLERWPAARLSLEKAKKNRVISKEQANKDEAALLLAQAKEELKASQGRKALELAEKARSLAPDWIPAALVLAEAQIVTGNSRGALRTIEKIWKKSPHPQLVPLVHWACNGKALEGFKFVEKLTRLAPEDPVCLMALADAALRADLWGEARRALMTLVSRMLATHLTYQMLARLERHESANERAASAWLARVAVAQYDPVWMCDSCGAAHEYWEGTCASCGSFNSMTWAVPGKSRQSQDKRHPVFLMDAIK